MKSFYTKHIFFCNNIRKSNKPCCSQHNVKALYRYAKDICRDKLMTGEGKIGISESRCLGRCEIGPVAVVYPDNIWYKYIDKDDIDEIINNHLIGGQPVKRLKID